MKRKNLRLGIIIVLIGIMIYAAAALLFIKKEEQSNQIMLDKLEVLYEEVERLEDQELEIDATAPLQEVAKPLTLGEINDDYVGWLKINGVISLPVVQGDDNEFYLNHNFYKAQSVYGTVFLDYRNEPDDLIEILYGHNVTDGQMLTAILNYEDEVFRAAHSLVTYAGGEYQVVAAVYVNINEVGKDYWNIPAKSIDASKRLLEALMDTERTVSDKDHYLLLSTCIQEKEEERFVVIAQEVNKE